MASRGSVIPLFIRQIINEQAITITDPLMTRFMMTLDDAVDLVLHAFENGKNGDIFVQKAPAATIDILVKALLEIMSKPNHKVNVIGTRHGEKLFEALCSREEMLTAEEQGEYYRIPADNRDLNYSKFFEEGNSNFSEIEDYNSHNTHRLDIEGMKALLRKLDFIQEIENGNIFIPEGV
jgi:UDP-glucose 4-epimerase